MKKRIVSLLLCVVMCFSLVPTAAFAEVVGTADGAQVVTTPAEPTGSDDPVDPADPVDPVDPTDPTDPVDPTTPEGDDTPAVDEEVAAVQALIDALPTTDFAAMTEEEIDALYAAYEAYYLLSEEQQAQINGAEVFDALLAAFEETDTLLETVGYYCIVCGAKSSECKHFDEPEAHDFVRWTETSSLPDESGYYYLNHRVDLTATWYPVDGTVLYLDTGAVIYGPASKNDNKSNGAVINVSGKLTFTLTGDAANPGVITHKPGEYGIGVIVENGGTFNMYHGSISGNNTTYDARHLNTSGYCAAGVVIRTSASTFNMYGGVISENNNTLLATATSDIEKYYGGGVYNHGKFNMYGGTIKDNNKATDTRNRQFFGGGVCNFIGSTFIMEGGTITGNYATLGGGVYNGMSQSTSKGIFTMSGGTISNNYTIFHDTFFLPGDNKDKYPAPAGGGVYNSANGVFTLSGRGSIENNIQSDEGGGVYNEGTFAMSGGKIDSNKTNIYGGGVYNAKDATFAMSGGTISNGTVTGTTFEYNYKGDKEYKDVDSKGGGVYNEGSFSLSGGTISGNKVSESKGDGGGVYTTKALTIGDAVISGNTAKWGGGVYALNAALTITGAKINDNTAQSDGGGVFVSGNATHTMTAGQINGNKANNGGGVHMGSGVTFNMSGGQINNNEATLNFQKDASRNLGGGVYNKGGTFNLSGDAQINGNQSNGNGGGVNTTGKFTMTGGQINENVGGQVDGGNAMGFDGGGGVFNEGTFNMSGGQINHNKLGKIASLYGYGGGMYNNNGTFNMSGNAEISRNTSVVNKTGNGRGGGVANRKNFNMSGNAKISGCESGLGGGVYNISGTFKMSENACITENTVYGNGGGIYIYIGSNFEMKGGKITGNRSTVSGGGIFNASASTVKMTGGEISGNIAEKRGGGVFNAFVSSDCIPKFEMTGGKITGNTAKDSGGGVYVNNQPNNAKDQRGSKLVVGGNAQITGNTLESGAVSNVGLFYVAGYKAGAVTVNSATFSGSVGIISDDHVVGRQVLDGNAVGSAYGYFTSDKDGFIIDSDGKLACAHTNMVQEGDVYKCDDCDKVISHIVATVTRGSGENTTISYYASVEEAAAAVTANCTLTLLEPQTFGVELSKSVTYTLDVNHMKLGNLQVSGGTVTIINANVTGETIATAPNLNITGGTVVLSAGEIYRNVTVTGGKVQISSGKFNKLEVKDNGSAELSGGEYESVFNYAGGGAKALLSDGYRYWKIEKNDWYDGKSAGVGKTIVDLKEAALSLKITADPANALTEALIYGYSQSVELTANMVGGTEADSGNVYTYKWYLNDGVDAVSNEQTYTFSTGKAAGTYTIKCEATGGGKTYTDTVTIIVEKQSFGMDDHYWPKGATLFYTGSAQELAENPTGEYDLTGRTVYYKQADGTWNTDIPKGTDAGTYTVYWYIDGGANYADVGSPTSPRRQNVTIAPQPIKIAGFMVAEKIYDGTTAATVTGVTFQEATGETPTVVSLTENVDYQITSAAFDSSMAGENSVTIDVTLLNDNYTFLVGTNTRVKTATSTKAQDIIKAPIEPVTIIRYVNADSTYTYPLDELVEGLAVTQNHEDITWTVQEPFVYAGETNAANSYYDSAEVDISSGNSVLELKTKAASESLTTAADNLIGTLKLAVTGTNIESSEENGLVLQIKLYLTTKGIPMRTGSLTKNPDPITYGTPLKEVGLSDPTGVMKVGETVVEGTFEWVNENRAPQAGTRWVEWTFTPTDGESSPYATVNGAASITVNKATPTIMYGENEVTQSITKPYDATAIAFTATHKVWRETSAGSGTYEYTPETVLGTWSWRKLQNSTYVPAAAPVNVADSGKYAVTFTPNDTTNYNEVTFTVEVTINAKELTITNVTAKIRDYEPGNTTVTLESGTLNGVEGTDEVIVVPGVGTMQTADAGTGKSVTTNITLAGTAAGNYTLTQPTDVTATITRKEITADMVTITNPIYNGDLQTPTVVVKDGDTTLTEDTDYTVTVTPVTPRGEYPLTINGAGNNYTGTVNQNWNIEPMELTADMVTITNPVYTGQPQAPGVTVTVGNKTLTEGTDYTLTVEGEGGRQTNVGNYRLNIVMTGESGDSLTLPWSILPQELTVTAAAADKTYDGTTAATATVAFSKAGGATVELEENQYTVSAAFENATAGTGKKVTILVTLLDPNYCFKVAEPSATEPDDTGTTEQYGIATTALDDDTAAVTPDNTGMETAATPDSATQKTLTGEANITPAPWTGARPTAKEDPLRVKQNPTIQTGDVNLLENLPDSIPGIREGSFTVGTTTAKVSATVDGNGKLTFTITGGRAGESFTIPVTFTCTNYLVGGGTPLTIRFDVVVELTGPAHDPIRRQPIFTGTAGGNDGAAGGTSTGEDVTSPDTGDAGIAVYAMLSLCAALGTGVTLGRKKRRD